MVESTAEKRLRILITAQDNTQAAFNQITGRIKALNIKTKRDVLGGGLTPDQIRSRKIVNLQLEETKNLLDMNVKRNKILIGQQKRLVQEGRKFRFEYLGIMFAGMALQRVTDKFLRSAITAYNEAFEETSALEKQTNKLTASWKFFQFQLIDALTSSEFFGMIIDKAVNLIDAFSKMDSAFRLGIVATAAAAFGVGGGLFFIGQMALGLLSLKLVWSSGVLQSLATKFTSMPIVAGLTMRNLLVTGIAIKAIIDLTNADTFQDAIKSIGENMALYGLVSGKPWIIAAGLTIRLIDPLSKAIRRILGIDAQESVNEIAESINEQLMTTWGMGLDPDSFTYKARMAFVEIEKMNLEWKEGMLGVKSEVVLLDAELTSMSDTGVQKISAVKSAMGGEENSLVTNSAAAETKVYDVKKALDSLQDKVVNVTIRTSYEYVSAGNYFSQPT